MISVSISVSRYGYEMISNIHICVWYTRYGYHLINAIVNAINLSNCNSLPIHSQTLNPTIGIRSSPFSQLSNPNSPSQRCSPNLSLSYRWGSCPTSGGDRRWPISSGVGGRFRRGSLDRRVIGSREGSGRGNWCLGRCRRCCPIRTRWWRWERGRRRRI